jgi:hypothetical protein
MRVIAAALQLYTLSSFLTLTCMNDLTGAKVLKGERILFNEFKDVFHMSNEVRKIKYLIKRSKKKLINFDICGFIGVMIVVHNTGVLTEKFFTLIY